MTEILPLAGIASPFCSLSHLAGAVAFGYLFYHLLRRRLCGLKSIAVAVFALSGTLLLSVSAIYHSISENSGIHNVFQRLDHAAIFVFIAGTFTPIHAILFRGFMRWGMLAIVWAVSIAGITAKTVLFDAIPEPMSLLMYILLGWLGLVAGITLWQRHDFGFIRPLVWGGIAYTLGALLEFTVQPVLIPGIIGPHEIFHIAVLAGISYHWTFIQNSCGIRLPLIYLQPARAGA